MTFYQFYYHLEEIDWLEKLFNPVPKGPGGVGVGNKKPGEMMTIDEIEALALSINPDLELPIEPDLETPK